MKFLIPLFGLLFAITAANAEMYRWVDEHGKVQYSDQPPPAKAKSSKTLNIKNQPAPAAAAGEKTVQEKEMDYKKRQTEAADAEAKKKKEEEEKVTRAKNCEAAKKQVQIYESGSRVVTQDEKGERVFLDDAQRAKALADARKAVSEWCK